MKTLLVMRHAKSSWDDPNWSDFERPLNNRGLHAAPFMGKTMLDKNMKPDLIVSSSAERAKQTALLVKEALHCEKEIQFESRIYEASATTLLHLISEFSAEFNSIMLVGHNPGMEDLISILTGNYCSMPTAALAEISLNIDNWSDVGAVKGIRETVLRPKELMK